MLSAIYCNPSLTLNLLEQTRFPESSSFLACWRTLSILKDTACVHMCAHTDIHTHTYIHSYSAYTETDTHTVQYLHACTSSLHNVSSVEGLSRWGEGKGVGGRGRGWGR